MAAGRRLKFIQHSPRGHRTQPKAHGAIPPKVMRATAVKKATPEPLCFWIASAEKQFAYPNNPKNALLKRACGANKHLQRPRWQAHRARACYSNTSRLRTAVARATAVLF